MLILNFRSRRNKAFLIYFSKIFLKLNKHIYILLMAGSSNGNIHMATIANNDNARYASRSTTPLSTRQSHIVTKGSHEWLIEDFTKREETTGTSLSTRFTTPCIDGKGVNHETVWRLKAYPKGCDSDHRDYISIFINQVSLSIMDWGSHPIRLLLVLYL